MLKNHNETPDFHPYGHMGHGEKVTEPREYSPIDKENDKGCVSESAIGVFDSGVGGLTVVREIIRQLPDEKIIYFGDTARVPYGSKSSATVNRFSAQITRFLLTKEVKAIVVACNTASALALDELKRDFELPIIEVVVPGARTAIEKTTTGRIGVIGTEATIRSGIYQRIIHSTHPEILVTAKACPLFVPLVEEGFRDHHVTGDVIDYYLQSMKEADVDTMILGCTHYPLLRSRIKNYLGEKIELINPAYETAKDIKKLLETTNLENKSLCSSNKYRFYVSDGAEKFRKFACSVMSIDVPETKVVNIEEY
jgi:glutamate racemase